MVKNVLVFVPNSLNLAKNGFLEGVRKEYDDCEAFYITSDFPVRENPNVIGVINSDVTKVRKDGKAVHIDVGTSKLTLLNYGSITPNVVRIIYDFKAFRDCQDVKPDHYGVHFKFLCNNVKKRVYVDNGHTSVTTRFLSLLITVINFLLVIFESTVAWGYSTTVSHFCDDIKEFKLVFTELKKGRFSPKSGNFILSRLLDLVLGILLLQLFIKNEKFVVSFIEEVRETIIHNFRDLLIYLMGSPIGLKLNHGFNKSLGTFFFYHISLWRVFLITMQPFLRVYFKILVLPGVFGFSYQIAMLSDLISIATFHVYCIYVYAARLLFLQLKGLLSLFRLFIGRKYNPLRTRVDSYQYSQHQLFIGTLGFTVLLFLLPTTMMYYTVFVIFRLAILIVTEVLRSLRHVLQSLPVFILLLFLVKSPLLSGPVCLRVKRSRDGVATFEARLKMLPFIQSVRDYAPQRTTAVSLSLGKVLTGALL